MGGCGVCLCVIVCVVFGACDVAKQKLKRRRIRLELAHTRQQERLLFEYERRYVRQRFSGVGWSPRWARSHPFAWCTETPPSPQHIALHWRDVGVWRQQVDVHCRTHRARQSSRRSSMCCRCVHPSACPPPHLRSLSWSWLRSWCSWHRLWFFLDGEVLTKSPPLLLPDCSIRPPPVENKQTTHNTTQVVSSPQSSGGKGPTKRGRWSSDRTPTCCPTSGTATGTATCCGGTVPCA